MHYPEHIPSFIHGKPRQANGQRFASINPANAQVLGYAYSCQSNDVDLAVQSAQQGVKVWQGYTASERGKILLKAAEILRKRNDELAKLEVMDCGKPIQEALVVDIASGADCLAYFGGSAAAFCGRQYPLHNAFAYTRYEPLGVCAGIGAWNYPIQIACWKSAPALASGNAMLFKPSELTPLTAYLLAEIYCEAGLPNGVFNVLQGNRETGTLLTCHPDIAKVSLTGSVATGKTLMNNASQTLKRVTLELGGKSPLIIFADADLDEAVSAAMMANFYTQGEVCTHGTRVFVHESIHTEFLKRLVKRTTQLVVGNPLEAQTQIGALISQAHQQKVLNYIQQGIAEGAQLAIGGHTLSPRGCEQGFFVAPTILTDCQDSMRISQEEIFGPVLSLLSFADENEVIQRANHTRFGLAAGLFTHDISRAHRVAAALKAGICWINNYNITPIEIPFGGAKESGIGFENSIEAMQFYTQLKTVYVELGKVQTSYQ